MYTTHSFYEDKYHGDLIADDEVFEKHAERASDWLDTVTFRRLVSGLPSDEWDAGRVQKCVCALADIYYQLDEAQKNALVSATDAEPGKVKAVSSGSESITYMTPTEQAGNAKQLSAVYAAAGNKVETDKLLMSTTKEYLSGVSDDTGTPLLYAGV